MVVGTPGAGKTCLVRYLAERLSARGSRVAVVSTDMGQATVGPPICLGLALGAPGAPPTALWFIGDTQPGGNLLQVAVGAGRLVERAHALGARTVIVDTTGLAQGPVARVLEYHEALEAGVDHVVALQHGRELWPLLAVLGGACRAVHVLGPVAAARDRPPGERRQYREALLRAHLQGGELVPFGVGRLPNWKWALGRGGDPPFRGALLGLLDRRGFCLGLGLLEELREEQVLVYTAWREPAAVARVQVGRLRLRRSGEELG